MAHFFTFLLAVLQVPAPAPPAAPTISLDARWVTSFDTPAAATPGFDENSAFVPLKDKLVAVDLNRGTIRWQLDVATPFTPATGEGLVFSGREQTIDAREASTGATRWQATISGSLAAPLYYDTGWLVA